MRDKIKKKILVVHEWWGEFGGSEKVALALHNATPGSELLVLRNLASDKFDLRASWVRHVPFMDNKLLLAATSLLAYRTLTLKHYDVVVTSSHTFAHTTKLINDSGTKYYSYVHTPARSLWHPEADSRGLPLSPNSRFRSALQRVDMVMGAHVDSFAANSTEVRERIKSDWGRDSIVINPPIEDFNEDSLTPPIVELPKKYLLSAGRLINYKRHDFSIRLAAHLDIPIVIAGGGPEENNLRKLAHELKVQSTFIVNPKDSEWVYLLKEAECLVFPSHEDFGMTPIEAMKLGTPVLALGTGGALDYIIDGVNGYKIKNFSLEDWGSAYELLSMSTTEIKNSVAVFSYARFDQQVKNWIFNDLN